MISDFYSIARHFADKVAHIYCDLCAMFVPDPNYVSLTPACLVVLDSFHLYSLRRWARLSDPCPSWHRKLSLVEWAQRVGTVYLSI